MKRLLGILYLLFALFLHISACTTAIISGKYTVDGRPLLYKHRDTSTFDNKLMAFSDGKYSYVGVVNSKDKAGKEVWGGYNSAGFTIMNSASYNLNPNNNQKDELEGVVMKMALQRCATLADFEKLLDSLPKPMYVSANFGVIDAQGGAAYYETGNYKYKKYDVNDPEVAPTGYLIRTNSSDSGDRGRDRGVSRFLAASPLFHQAALANNLSHKFLLRDVSRHLTHGLTGDSLYDKMRENSSQPVYAYFRDFIPRYTTSSVIVVQGVKEQESVSLTTMWTMMGSPLATVTIPVWLNTSNSYPSILTAGKYGNSKMCDWALELKKQLFPLGVEEGKDYINVAALIADDKSGILQKILPLEDHILDKADNLLEKWRKAKQDPREISEFCNWADQFVTESYHQIFSIP